MALISARRLRIMLWRLLTEPPRWTEGLLDATLKNGQCSNVGICSRIPVARSVDRPQRVFAERGMEMADRQGHESDGVNFAFADIVRMNPEYDEPLRALKMLEMMEHADGITVDDVGVTFPAMLVDDMRAFFELEEAHVARLLEEAIREQAEAEKREAEQRRIERATVRRANEEFAHSFGSFVSARLGTHWGQKQWPQCEWNRRYAQLRMAAVCAAQGYRMQQAGISVTPFQRNVMGMFPNVAIGFPPMPWQR